MSRRILAGFCAICCFVAMGAVFFIHNHAKDAPEQKFAIEAGGLQVDGSLEGLLAESEIVVAGVVSEELPGFYTNPSGDQVSAKTGEKISNAWETDYLVKVTKVYKGEPYSTDTIWVKTLNRIGQPPQAGETYTYGSEDQEFYLQVGKACVLCLADAEELTLNMGESGYEVVWGDRGYFLAGAEGIYQSTSFEMKEVDIEREVAAADGYMGQLPGQKSTDATE